MTDVLDRVRKLVALAAGNENRGEAAFAAIKACELIKQHGIQLVPKDAPRAGFSRPGHPYDGDPFSGVNRGTYSNRPSAKPPGWEDFEEVLRRAAEAQAQEEMRRARERARATETDSARRPWNDPFDFKVDWRGDVRDVRDAPSFRNVKHVDFVVRAEYGTLHCSIREPKDNAEWRAFKEAYQAFIDLWNGWSYKMFDKGCLMEFEAELVRRLGDVGKRHGVWFRVQMRG